MDKKKVLATFKGGLTFIPYITNIIAKKKIKTSHSSTNARFCYSFWLRLLVLLHKNKILDSRKVIAEIGTSGSLGIGLCALLSGSEKYYALDIEDHYDPIRNIKMLEDLIGLFSTKAPIPDEKEFPQINIKLQDYSFPEFLNENEYKSYIGQIKFAQIADALKGLTHNSQESGLIQSYIPWERSSILGSTQVGLIFSHAVMEHVLYPHKIYKNLALLLKYDGIMFHDIEYHAHDLSDYWNGHYTYNDFLWKLTFGGRKYFLNRLTHSDHEKLIEDAENRIIMSERCYKETFINKCDLAGKFKFISELDLKSYGGIILSKKNE